MGCWSDERYCDRQVLIICPGKHGETFDADRCAALLQEADMRLAERIDAGEETRLHYGYGDHVSDPLAVVKRLLLFTGWQLMPTRPGMMRCPEHKKEEKE